MSLICGTLAWLNAHNKRPIEPASGATAGLTGQAATAAAAAAGTTGNNSAANSSEDEPDWVLEHVAKSEAAKRQRGAEQAAELEQRFKRRRAELMNQRAKYKKSRARGLMNPADAAKWLEKALNNGPEIADSGGDGGGEAVHGDSDDEFLIEDFDEAAAVMDNDSDSDDGEEDPAITQILFCSRTHSQLAQFVEEIKKSPFAGSTRVVTLGSRASLCVNESVRQLGSVNKINDKCKDLKDKGANSADKEKGGCPYMNQKRVAHLADRVLTEVQDIEQLVTLGRKSMACAYYGARQAIALAQVVAMPYNMLLHKSTRESVGIKLKDSIVVVDEAHNLVETIEAIHSAESSGALLQRACAQLGEYRERYKRRLNSQNLTYIDQILLVLRSLLKVLTARISGGEGQRVGGSGGETTTQLSLNDFMHSAKIDDINLYHLLSYMERSQISKKVNGFVLKYTADATPVDGGATVHGSSHGEEYVSKHVSALRVVEGFLRALTNTDHDGRVLVTTHPRSVAKCRLKYLLLNSSVYFDDVLEQCRAVIVAGGTMSPISSFVMQLLSVHKPPPKLSVFQCGHVIPAENLLPLALCAGPSGKVPLNFSFKNRSDPRIGPVLIKELGQLVLNLCNVCPDGMVVFLPSYDYEQKVYDAWKASGLTARIEAKKQIFREPHGAGQVDAVLNDYAECIRVGGTGSLLLSVVGGKLSEGINFKDELGRCVVMVGLPFANRNSPELREKMAYLETVSKKLAPGLDMPSDAPTAQAAGMDHYENLCMRAVNQSIGRAIRHQRDYSTIVLVDERYATPRISAKLPGWVGDLLLRCQTFGPVIKKIRQFFRSHSSGAAPATQ